MTGPTVQQIRLAQVTLPSSHPEGPGTAAVYGFLVRDGRHCILVDTGIGADCSLINDLYAPQCVELPDALAQARASLADITAIVNSHLHFDHCGGNRHFPGVPIFVQEAELEASRDPKYTIGAWVNFDRCNYVPVRGSYSISAGLEILATPGHTPGHQSLLVRTGSSCEILVCQAAYTSAEFEDFSDPRAPGLSGYLQSNASRPESYTKSLATLHRIRPDRAYFSHDPTVWRRAAS